MDSSVRIESLTFVLDDTKVWDRGVTSDVQLHVNDERIAPDSFPGNQGIELTKTLCQLYNSIASLEQGDEPFPYLFPCGGCGELGCTQIRWKMTRRDEDVEIRMRGYQEPLGAGRYHVDFDILVSAVVELVDDFVCVMEGRNVVQFDFPHSEFYELHSITDFKSIRDDLSVDV